MEPYECKRHGTVEPYVCKGGKYRRCRVCMKLRHQRYVERKKAGKVGPWMGAKKKKAKKLSAEALRARALKGAATRRAKKAAVSA